MGTPLSLAPLKDQPLTVVIYWPPRSGPDLLQSGHSALIIDTSRVGTGTDFYVSWMGGAAVNGNQFVREKQAHTIEQDMSHWGGHLANPTKGNRIPTRWVALQGLHVDNMKDYWDDMRNKQNAHWKLMDKNCATATIRVLRAGGSDQFATAAKSQLVWWPTDVIRYARSMGTAVHSTS